MKEVGISLRKVREEKSISIRQLAKITGISASYISQIENNHRKNPKPYVIKSLCDGLGINYYDLLVQTNKLSPDEAAYQKKSYEMITSKQDQHIMEANVPLEKSNQDLYYLLTEYPGDIYYKDKILNNDKKEQINIILQTILK